MVGSVRDKSYYKEPAMSFNPVLASVFLSTALFHGSIETDCCSLQHGICIKEM